MKNFNQIINEEFYYCYDLACSEFLKKEKKIPYLCNGLNINTKREFYLYQRTDSLSAALDEFYKE